MFSGVSSGAAASLRSAGPGSTRRNGPSPGEQGKGRFAFPGSAAGVGELRHRVPPGGCRTHNCRCHNAVARWLYIVRATRLAMLVPAFIVGVRCRMARV